MLHSWNQPTGLKTYVLSILSGDIPQQSRAGIQNFFVRGWMRSRGGSIVRKIRERRSRKSWSLLRIRDNFEVSGCDKQRGDDLLHRTGFTMILAEDVGDVYDGQCQRYSCLEVVA